MKQQKFLGISLRKNQIITKWNKRDIIFSLISNERLKLQKLNISKNLVKLSSFKKSDIGLTKCNYNIKNNISDKDLLKRKFNKEIFNSKNENKLELNLYQQYYNK